MIDAKDRTKQIALKNDRFRRGYSYLITRGVASLPDVLAIIKRVRGYSDFNQANDPYAEHDFGSFSYDGVSIFWKIDYYNQDLSAWSDPLDRNTRRILTVMLAEEY